MFANACQDIMKRKINVFNAKSRDAANVKQKISVINVMKFYIILIWLAIYKFVLNAIIIIKLMRASELIC